MIDEKSVEELINSMVRLNESNLEKEMIQHSGNFAWLCTMLAKARKKYDQKKFELDVLESELGKEYRDIIGRSGKVTEKAVAECIVLDERWQEKKKEMMDAKEEVEVIDALVEAMRHKKDMIVSLCLLLKEQIKTGMIDSVNKKEGE